MLTSKPEITDKIFADISKEYADKLITYPPLKPLEIPNAVYVTEQIFDFWEDVGPYLPYGTKLVKGYVRPDDHAVQGLEDLIKLKPSVDLSLFVSTRPTTNNKQQVLSSSDFFSGMKTVSVETSVKNGAQKTHPSLNGKFSDYYLFQYDYSLVQKALGELGVNWSLPYEDDYQKGLSVDIEISESKILPSDVSTIITGIAVNNPELNIKEVVVTGNILKISFNSSKIPSFPFEFAVLNVGPSNNVSDCFDQTILQKIYKHLKDNGYGDLEDTMPHGALHGLPLKSRKKGTALATAIRDSFIDIMGGSEGLFSVMQASTNEYLMGVINGLVAANKVVYDELDRIGGGLVKQKAINAFESGMNRSVVSKGVQSLLNNGLDINDATGKSILAKESTEVVLANIKEIKDSLILARTQES